MKKIIILLVILSVPTLYSAEISLDESASTGMFYDGSSGQYKIIIGADVVFALRYDNTGGATVNSVSNGFKVSVNSGTFTPIFGSVNSAYPWINPGGFFDVFNPNCFGCDGIDEDTISFVGTSFFTGTGFPADFNDVAVYIHTGGVQEGNVMCLDSSWFPPAGIWAWGSNQFVLWGGPYCFETMNPGVIPPVFDPLTPDTIILNTCGAVEYQFVGEHHPLNDFPDPIYYALRSGPGTIDVNTGEWTMEVAPEDTGLEFDITVVVYYISPDLGSSKNIKIIIDIPPDPYTFDVNADCTSDISDLVRIIDFFFKEIIVPPNIHLAEVDDVPGLDIADVVYLIDYMFNEGPPPIR